MKHMTLKSLSCLAQVAILVSISGTSFASEPSGYKVVEGTAIYFAVLPAEMIRKFPKGQPEAGMHGGVPSGAHIHHVLVALFDAKTFDRITDAEVKATVTETGLAGKTKALEPFTVAGALTYGNYFDMPAQAIYRIKVEFRRAGPGKMTATAFDYRHH